MLTKLFTKTPKWAKLIFNRLTWHIGSDEKTLYLTFDDGPIPGVTEWVLDTLQAYDAKATFFCIGDNIMKHPEVFQQILSEGHKIGNHTQNHLNARKVSTSEYMDNFSSCEQTIEKHLPPTPVDRPKLFRPPYGRTTFKTRNRILKSGYQMVMWDVISADYRTDLTKESCWQNIHKNATNGSIIVFHDSLKAEKNMKYALLKTLEYYSENGYSFKAIP